MYYLLEGEIKIYENSRSIGEIDGKLFEAYHLFPDKEDIACLGKIKKQSENVYELIEVGDLVRYLNDIYEIKHVYYIDDGVVNFVTSNCGICFPSWGNFLKGLNAIYKPDSQGNYIKVWEVKEDE